MGEAQHEDQAQATRKSVRVYAPASPGDRSEAPTAGRSCTSTYKKRGPRQKDHGESNNNTSGGGGKRALVRAGGAGRSYRGWYTRVLPAGTLPTARGVLGGQNRGRGCVPMHACLATLQSGVMIATLPTNQEHTSRQHMHGARYCGGGMLCNNQSHDSKLLYDQSSVHPRSKDKSLHKIRVSRKLSISSHSSFFFLSSTILRQHVRYIRDTEEGRMGAARSLPEPATPFRPGGGVLRREQVSV